MANPRLVDRHVGLHAAQQVLQLAAAFGHAPCGLPAVLANHHAEDIEGRVVLGLDGRGYGEVMPERNRVTPEGEIVAIPLRGLFMGNRGCLHEGREIVRVWETRNWIVCERDFRGRRVEQWKRGRYTPLFFHDEAVAFAAGHRPCAECRHRRYRAWCDAWEAVFGERASAATMDRRLHNERLDGRVQRRHEALWADLPDGTFVHTGQGSALVWGDHVVGWNASGYQTPEPRPGAGAGAGAAVVLTPPATLAILRHGYRPEIAFAPSG